MINDRVNELKGNLIVSCQALEDEPLHSSFIMGRMARAAKLGGASGIRANTVEDIREIRNNVSLPIICIIKKVYADSEVYITPTMREIDSLMSIDPDIVAFDATDRIRPGHISLDDFYSQVRSKYPDQLFMADCSTVEEAIHADRLGFDFIGTTLVGYTPYSANNRIEADNFRIIREILNQVEHPVIAEGHIDLPEKAAKVLELGCFSVVVGGAITRPMLITERYAEAIKEMKSEADKS